ncbi:hypothetical protein [Emticicia sp. 21SJ11W-3]|uniref:hypothetical protein n=1 Tax=Emticicia sp. 21SJ11W-3 TaxID=2916755 RepID=UPI0020A1BE65|nr:hypothetical protein [Emticicia sp. 21SJ11W-3]UTA68061.1 hypothetical protein MB380_21070 [Emticicia sp. 21SJ11W-3]
MIYHVLNGDSLALIFKETTIEGDVMIAREALIDGSLAGDNLPDFWQTRADSHGISLDEYQAYSVSEFDQIMNAPHDATFHLWFGYDLFCQVNMWFVISLIHNQPNNRKTYVVYPTFLAEADIWQEFGHAGVDDLEASLATRIKLEPEDIQLGNDLWQAYRRHDLQAFAQLSQRQSACFPYLKQVIQAHLDRFPAEGQTPRHERVLAEIIENGETDFHNVFRLFTEQQGIYGFGDAQLKPVYDKLMAR